MLTLPLPAPSLRTANRLPALRVLRIHNDLIRIVLSSLRWVLPAAKQIFSLLSGRRWDVPVVPGPTFRQRRHRRSRGSPCELAHRHRSRRVPLLGIGAAQDADAEEVMGKSKYGVLRGRAVAAAEERGDRTSPHFQIKVM